MRISDWSSDVCSSDLIVEPHQHAARHRRKLTIDKQTAFGIHAAATDAPDAEAELHLCRMMNLGDEVAFDAGEDEAAVLPEAAVDANNRIEIVEQRRFVEREIASVVDVAEHRSEVRSVGNECGSTCISGW